MGTDFMKSYQHLVEELLHRGTQVLVYNGQNDIIVETPGTIKWLEHVHYSSAELFRDTLLSVWKVDGKTAGYTKTAGNLTFATVNNAGHLVPMDQGASAIALANMFVAKGLAQ